MIGQGFLAYTGNMTAKTCRRCDETKPLAQFVKRAANRDGHTSVCKSCQQRPTPEQQREADRRYRLAHLEQRRAYVLQWDRDNPWSKLGRDARRRARKAGATVGHVDYRALSASASDCYLCGSVLAGDVHLDHLVPLARGGAHSASNLRPTHAVCNLRKSDKLLAELVWYVGPVDIGQRLCDAGATTTVEGTTS